MFNTFGVALFWDAWSGGYSPRLLLGGRFGAGLLEVIGIGVIALIY